MVLLAHAVQIYFKLHPNEIPEEATEFQNVISQQQNLYSFVTLVIGWGEVGVIMSLVGIGYVGLLQNKNIISLYNELFAYNEKILELTKERNIQLDRNHKKAQQNLEILIWLTAVGSTLVAFLMALTCLHPLEPTHALINEWLEIEWNFRVAYIPFILMFVSAIQSGGNMILTFALLIECYCFMALTILDDLTIESVHLREGKRCKLETRFYGVLEDEEICKLYRIQRNINIRIN